MRDVKATKRVLEQHEHGDRREQGTAEGPLWEAEYGDLQVIPSSTRTLPSKALVLFSELLELSKAGRVLDAGCGNGRNSVYLAEKGCEVDAVDTSETALRQLDRLARDRGVYGRVHSHNRSLADPLPFPNDHFDLALDSYVFCHFTDNDLKEHYRQEMARVLRPGGLLFSSVFCTDDAYYAQFADWKTKLAVDPNNGLTKRLYSESEIKAFFAEDFALKYFAKFAFEDIVLRQSYWRSILVCILQK